jgi:hypothetical protein
MIPEEVPIAGIALEARDGALVVVWHEDDSGRAVVEHRLRVPPSYDGGDLTIESTYSGDRAPSTRAVRPGTVASRHWRDVNRWLEDKMASVPTGREALRAVLRAHSRIVQTFLRESGA